MNRSHTQTEGNHDIGSEIILFLVKTTESAKKWPITL